MTVSAAAKRAEVTPATWLAAEKREANGTITVETLKKFLGALGYSLSYAPISESSLEQKLRGRARESAENEILRIQSTMALEDQAVNEEFGERAVKERTEDLIRSGNWKGLWQ